ncbi:hypothetical protein K7B10_00525 [Streptomyces flavotricini]|uniref:Uncharacterized protein n=1 Tax=Streptomyces flavotricini TaxID=66888 RepID=A0ABS8DX32_9ACTN|nr:hypothetical protein [Streptomyces flavotricini]MCC0093310.1 hypothetical protein [Streptomyces flavotricini]
MDPEREDLIQQRDAAGAETAQAVGDDHPATATATATATAAGHGRAKWFGGRGNPR